MSGMQIREPEILRIIEQIGAHYRANISNRYIRPALLYLPLDNQTWDQIESLTEESENFKYQGYHLDELYQQIIAASRLVAFARRELAPSLRSRLGPVQRGVDSDRVLRDMAINNFSSNLKIFADQLNELYIKLAAIDRDSSAGKSPLYARIPELKDIGRQLVGS